MWSSDMHGCGLNVWGSGSQILHATASAKAGPFTPAEVAVTAEAHNPQLVRAPDGSFLLLDSYGGPQAGCPNTTNYTTCTPGAFCGAKGPGLGSYTFHASNSTIGGRGAEGGLRGDGVFWCSLPFHDRCRPVAARHGRDAVPLLQQEPDAEPALPPERDALRRLPLRLAGHARDGRPRHGLRAPLERPV